MTACLSACLLAHGIAPFQQRTAENARGFVPSLLPIHECWHYRATRACLSPAAWNQRPDDVIREAFHTDSIRPSPWTFIARLVIGNRYFPLLVVLRQINIWHFCTKTPPLSPPSPTFFYHLTTHNDTWQDTARAQHGHSTGTGTAHTKTKTKTRVQMRTISATATTTWEYGSMGVWVGKRGGGGRGQNPIITN